MFQATPRQIDNAAVRRLTRKLLPVLAVVVLAALIAAHRLRTYREPLERDITTYAVIAHELLGGRELYSDLWDHKPPAVHVTFALAELLVGYGAPSVYLLNVSFGIATLAAVFLTAYRLARLRGAVLAGLVWVALSGDLRLQANQPNTEAFINACTAWAFFLFIRSRNRLLNGRELIAVALLASLASLYKHVAVLPVMGLAAVYVAWPPGGARRWVALGQQSLVFGAVGLTWAGMLGYFAVGDNRLSATIDALFVYNRFYAGELGSGGGRSIKAAHVLLYFTLMPACCAVALQRVRRRRMTRAWILYGAAVLGTTAAIVLPGWLHTHYFQLLVPFLAVAVGWTSLQVRAALPAPAKRWSYRLVHALVVLVVAYEASFLRLPAREWSEKKYGDVFVATYAQAQELDELLEPHETFYEWGGETGLYFASRRRPPSGVFYNFPLEKGPLKRGLAERVIRDFERERPEVLVVLERHLQEFQSHADSDPLFQYLNQRYVPFLDHEQRPWFKLFARRGGRVERTLNERYVVQSAESHGDGPSGGSSQ